jgi:hypothetical protein
MSFYNVTNPTSFSIVSDVRKLLVQPGKLIRFPQTQYFTGATSLTAEQLVAGSIIGDTTAGGFTLTLPSAENLITLLLGPGGFDVSSSDIFSFSTTNIASSNTLTIAVGTGGSGSNKTIAGASGGVSRTINLQISVTVSGGSTTYAYAML